MLSLFKKLFGKAAPAVPAVQPTAPHAPSAPMPTIEVAHLSLAAITARFPDEMKALLMKEPDGAATVALPLPTILKQLPAGTVKMSLASLQRQAQGLIKPLPAGDKRAVEVPLAEIFRHVRLHLLKRRPDQRPYVVPESGYNLFGDLTNPYAIAPDSDGAQPQILDLNKELSVDEPRVLKMDDGLREHFNGAPALATATAAAVTAAPEFKLTMPVAAPELPAPAEIVAHVPVPPAAEPIIPEVSKPVLAPAPGVAPEPAAATKLAPTAEKIPKPDGPILSVPLAALTAAWPDDIRHEVSGYDPATVVTLPLTEVAAGLARGRVAFSWGQVRAWLEPDHADPTAAAENIALQLPLKVIAPAFLATKKPGAERRNVTFDESIPALFNDSRAPESRAAKAPANAPLAVAEPAILAVVATPATSPGKVPETVGELFGQPQKTSWTPAEIVAGTVKLPGVAGAIVALQEGLQVASSLPDGVKSEVVAAFLPQIFARLNQYSGEMKLGEVDDLLFTTHGAHCQIYRLGYVYLAVLGQPGESLPWHELRLISEELASQTH